jgi:predicted alpha/beta-fold hydrolase
MSPAFRPLPFLGNAHVQTLLGTLLPGRVPGLLSRERHVLLPDGDRQVLHDSVPASWLPGGPLALLVHGLGGSHQSGYMRRLAALLLQRGFRVGRLDLRGAGRGASLARGSYNAGCSADVRVAAEEIFRTCPSSPLTLIGFSLGGNIVLKLAGEAAARPLPGLRAVAAVAPPIDLEGSAERLAARRHRLYDRFFVRNLLAQVRQQQGFFPDLPRPRFPRRLTVRLFDEVYTAPRGGFASALDYYRRSAALPLISRITVPTFILTARDDPFIPVAPFEALPARPHLEVHIAPGGGHLGFLGPDGAGGIRWAERRVLEWVTENNPTLLNGEAVPR